MSFFRSWLYLTLFAAFSSFAPAALAVTIDWVYVGDPGNPADTGSNCYSASCGSVGYAYYISKYEVTNAQYAEFLNAKAASDPLELYNPYMGEGFGGITRSGSSGSYTYSAIAGREDMPVINVSFYDALRFANWIHNGQGSGDTETGAYTLLGGEATPSNEEPVTRNAGASVFLPSENEWYKAAYYDVLSTSYFDYPVGTDTQTVCSAPTPTANRANCALAAIFDLSTVGSYTGSPSPYGTYDQGGNVWEWNEEIVTAYRGVRGGSWANEASYLAASRPDYTYPTNEYHHIGFRVASPIPEPGTGLLLGTGLVVLAARRRRFARW